MHLIVFDSEYIGQQAKNIDRAAKLIDDGIRELKAASGHSGWKCKERTTIDSALERTRNEARKLSGGLTDTTNALRAVQQQFADLERRSTDKTKTLIRAYRGQGNSSRWGSINVQQVPFVNDPQVHVYNFSLQQRKAIIEASAIPGAILGAAGGLLVGTVAGFIEDIQEKIDPESVFIEQAIIESGLDDNTVAAAGITAVKTVDELIKAYKDGQITLEELNKVLGTASDGVAGIFWKELSKFLLTKGVITGAAVCYVLGELSVDKALWGGPAGLIEGAKYVASLAKNYTAAALTFLDGPMPGTLPSDYPVESFMANLSNYGISIIDKPA